MFLLLVQLTMISLFAAWQGSFFLTKKPKTSRKNDASPHKSTTWPAVLSPQRSLELCIKTTAIAKYEDWPSDHSKENS
mgnify:CR=1 FL=1